MENDRLKQLAEELAARVDGVLEENAEALVLKVDASRILETLKEAKNFPEVPCDFLHDLCGLDQGSHLETVYQLTSLRGPQFLRVKAVIDREAPIIDSATGIWPGANYLEREAFDLFGIEFRGHPNLKRIYLWEGFAGHPLRKDYVVEAAKARDTRRQQMEGE